MRKHAKKRKSCENRYCSRNIIIIRGIRAIRCWKKISVLVGVRNVHEGQAEFMKVHCYIITHLFLPFCSSIFFIICSSVPLSFSFPSFFCSSVTLSLFSTSVPLSFIFCSFVTQSSLSSVPLSSPASISPCPSYGGPVRFVWVVRWESPWAPRAGQSALPPATLLWWHSFPLCSKAWRSRIPCRWRSRPVSGCQDNFEFKWVNTPRLEKKFPSGWKIAKNEQFL